MIRVSNNFHLIKGPNHAQYPYSNFLYIDDRIQTLLDSGWGVESLDRVGNRAIELVINSHFHLDHRGNNNAFPGAQVWAHRLDAPAIRSRKSFGDYYGLGSLPLDTTNLSESVANIPESPVHLELEDGVQICLGEVELQVIHTPGHTPGHCAFFCKEEGILYGGDIDLSKSGPFYGNMASNIDAFIASIKKLKDLNPAIYISAHRGLIMDDIPDCLDKYLSHIYEREARILESLIVPRTIEELTLQKPISGAFREPRELYFALEMIGVFHHLERLIKSGQIVRDGSYYVRVRPQAK
jgi:glyoxylase-like metal-dependent hydrolase (beta-lactamase superfamily II)